jgi:hypothetical protein
MAMGAICDIPGYAQPKSLVTGHGQTRSGQRAGSRGKLPHRMQYNGSCTKGSKAIPITLHPWGPKLAEGSVP